MLLLLQNKDRPARYWPRVFLKAHFCVRKKERKRERKNKATLPSTLEVLVIPVVLIRPVILQMKRLPFILILQKKLLPYRIGNQADPPTAAGAVA